MWKGGWQCRTDKTTTFTNFWALGMPVGYWFIIPTIARGAARDIPPSEEGWKIPL